MDTKNELKIFLSFSQSHTFDVDAFADRLRELLRPRMLRLDPRRELEFFSERETELIRKSLSLRQQSLESKIFDADLCVAFISHSFLTHESIRQELFARLVEHDEQGNLKKLFLVLDDIEPAELSMVSARLASRYVLLATPDPNTLAVELFRIAEQLQLSSSNLSDSTTRPPQYLRSDGKYDASLFKKSIACLSSAYSVRYLSITMIVIPILFFLQALADKTILLAPQLFATVIAGIFGLRTSYRWGE